MSDIRTLIFEDDPDLRESLRLLVHGTPGLQVAAAYPDCSFVRQAIREHTPDVVLMDIDMPNVDGITGLRTIKEIAPATQVLMITVFDQNDHVFEALCAGADGYLLKRSSPSEIIEAITSVTMGGAPMSPAIARKVLSFFAGKNKSDQEEGLTPKESEVLKLLVDGYSYKMIAGALEVGIETVRSHIKSIYRKLHVHSMSEAVAKAIRKGLV